MRRKVKQFRLINGAATININGTVAQSLDSGKEMFKHFKMEMSLDEMGIWVSYEGPAGERKLQLCPMGVISNVLLYDAEESVETQSTKSKSK
jgi:hypothetical protein